MSRALALVVLLAAACHTTVIQVVSTSGADEGTSRPSMKAADEGDETIGEDPDETTSTGAEDTTSTSGAVVDTAASTSTSTGTTDATLTGDDTTGQPDETSTSSSSSSTGATTGDEDTTTGGPEDDTSTSTGAEDTTTGEPPEPPPPPTLDLPDCAFQTWDATTVFADIVAPSCGCHASGSGGMLIFDSETLRSATKNVPATHADMPRITPGDPHTSFLLYKVLGQHKKVPGGKNGQAMPPFGEISDEQVCMLINWVIGGAQ